MSAAPTPALLQNHVKLVVPHLWEASLKKVSKIGSGRNQLEQNKQSESFVASHFGVQESCIRTSIKILTPPKRLFFEDPKTPLLSVQTPPSEGPFADSYAWLILCL